jgi:CO/xanthine dehydrogenase FAD-binding subunit
LAIFAPTEYLRPSTPDEVTKALVEYGSSARIIGGGTEIYELAERGLLSEITALVDLANLKMDRIEGKEGTALKIGASVKLAELEEHDAMNELPGLGAVLDSVRSIHPVQVKNLATVGGAVCSSIPFFDLPVGLAAVDAIVEVHGPQGSRKRPLTDFIVDFLTPDLGEGEFVTGVTIKPESYSASAFTKFSLTSNDWAIVNCACSLKIWEGSIDSARVVLGGVSSSGLLTARKTAEGLKGLVAEPGRQFDEAVNDLDSELNEAVSDYRASADYRRKVAKVLLRDALNRAVTRERG